jgi:uncharacterized protein (TIGR02996 family)
MPRTRKPTRVFDQPTSELEAELLSCIYSALDDDRPRLVYADFLQEQGRGPRAELIRSQCALERSVGVERTRLEALNAVLLKKHFSQAKTWAALKKIPARNWTFRRGFVDGVQLSATRFVELAEELFRLVPTLQRVRFPEASNETTALAGCAWLARLKVIDLSKMCTCGSCPIENELEVLFQSSHLSNVEELNLADNPLGSRGVLALAKSTALPSLRTLNLARTQVGKVGVAALLKASLSAHLELLDLTGNDVALRNLNRRASLEVRLQ